MLAFRFLLHHKPPVEKKHAESVYIQKFGPLLFCDPSQHCSQSLGHVYHILSYPITDLPALY